MGNFKSALFCEKSYFQMPLHTRNCWISQDRYINGNIRVKRTAIRSRTTRWRCTTRKPSSSTPPTHAPSLIRSKAGFSSRINKTRLSMRLNLSFDGGGGWIDPGFFIYFFTQKLSPLDSPVNSLFWLYFTMQNRN